MKASHLRELLSELGNPGRYQICVFLLLCLNYFPLVFNHVIMAFLGSRPPHQCHSAAYYPYKESSVGSLDNVWSQYDVNNSTSQLAAATVTSGSFGKCEATYELSSGRNVSVSCPDGDNSFVLFKKNAEASNIVTEWNLVCDQSYLSSLATTIYFCGVMVGGVVFGHLADKFGRKPVMLLTLYLPVIVGVGTAFAPWYWLFVGLRFIQGVLMQGLQTSTYTLAMELFLPKHRSYAGAILECFWGLSVMATPALAYLIPNWRHLVLAISLPSVLAVCYMCLVPESLRWLIMVNRVEDAEVLVSKVTTFNKLPFPQQSWQNVKLQHGDQDGRQYSFLDLLRTPQLRRRSLVLFYVWFAIAVAYYGLTWRLASLPGNKHLNFFIAGAVEFVAYTMVIYITKRFGRKKPLLVYFFLAAVFCVSAGICTFCVSAGICTMQSAIHGVDLTYLSSGFAVAGKFAMGGLFSVIFLYTSELYPTVIRNIGMGSCAFWARVGGVVAPQILLLDQFSEKALPLILFGIVTFIGGLLTIILPETLDRKLPDTIDDAEQFGSHGSSLDEGNMEEMQNLRGVGNKNFPANI